MSPLSGKYFSMKLPIVSWRKVVVNYLLTLPGSSVLRWDNRLQPWWNIPYGCKSGFTSNIPWLRRKGTTILPKNPWNTYARPFPLVATTRRPCICNVSCNDNVHVCWSSINFVNFFFGMWEEKVKCLRRRVVFKRNFHLKRSECIRAEFAVVSCCVALEQRNCARTCKDLAQEMSLLEQPIYRSIFSSIRVISEGKC